MSEFEQSVIYQPFSSPAEAESLGFYGLSELVMKGYGFSGDENYTLAQFHEEYGKEDKIMFFIKQENLVIASLVLNPKPDILGKKVVNVSGIVVKHEHRGKGLASNLFKFAIETLKPDLFVGNTKSPSAVLARSSSLSKFGFVTYYGLSNVTSNVDVNISDKYLDFLNGYIQIKKVNHDSDFVYTVSIDLLPSNIPDTSTFPKYIENAFIPVVKKQVEIGSSFTAVMPLISIESSLLQKGVDIHVN